jgi:hypothetical protein
MHNWGLSESEAPAIYAEDPSRFCKHVWESYGPNNGSERQMLEAK